MSLIAFGQSSQRYEHSFDLIDGMMRGKPISFKRAVVSVEYAFLDGKLDTIKFQEEITGLTRLALKVCKNRELKYSESDKDKVSKWAALFSIMTDTLKLKINGEDYRYIPFSYDFNDVFGHGEWSNMFVSKLLETRKGNCHSLPYLYKILAEEMGVDARLSLAPNHVYIKHRSLRDGWYNTELTSSIFPVDAWLMASGYIHLDAITNGVYMKALSDKESLALVMIDLALSYQRTYPDNDGAFILKCCDAALAIYPNFANALILQAETRKTILNKSNDPDKIASGIQELEKLYVHIHSLGYRDMPESMYLEWLTTLRNERDKYENKKLSTFNQN